MNEAVKFGWNSMKSNFWFFVGIFIVGGLAMVLPTALMLALEYMGRQSSVSMVALRAYLSSFLQVVSWVVNLIIGMGYITIALKLVDGQKPAFKDLFTSIKHFFSFLLVNLCYGVIVFVGILLLIVPGIMWALKFQLAPYFVIDRGLDPITALKASAVATKGAKVELLLFGILLQFINAAGFLVILLGLFATIPTTMVALAHMYRQLSTRVPATAA